MEPHVVRFNTRPTLLAAVVIAGLGCSSLLGYDEVGFSSNDQSVLDGAGNSSAAGRSNGGSDGTSGAGGYAGKGKGGSSGKGGSTTYDGQGGFDPSDGTGGQGQAGSGGQGPAGSGGQPGGPLAFGVYVNDSEVGGEAPWNPDIIDNFVSMVGAKPTVWMWYSTFDAGFWDVPFDGVASRGYQAMVSWAPSASNAEVAAGNVDDQLIKFAQKAAAWNKRLYIRLGWEMNLSYIGKWCVGPNSTADQFIAMWRHVHDVVTPIAPEVRWFWCPSQPPKDTPNPPLSTYYPGDDYVDVAGFDAYNWGTSQGWSKWESVAEIYTDTYNEIASFTNKPMIIGETGSVGDGGDKAAWMRDGFLNQVPSLFPRIIGVIYFSENAPPEWRVQKPDGSGAVEAFREVLSSPVYGGHLP